MICLSRLDGREVWLNEDLLLALEETPDTMLSFTTGAHVLVREPAAEVVDRIVAFRRRVLSGLPPVTTGSGRGEEG
jgi:flagellar protein FlbD